MKQLQRLQNSLAGIVSKPYKFCNITHAHHSMHWLKIKYKIDFKINTSVYKTLHINKPVNFRELSLSSEKQRTLRN